MTGIERLRELAQEYLNCSKDHTTVDVIPYGVSVLLNDIADQIEHEQRRDPAADVSMSAYDLLPADERAAIAWVREHGGISEVKEEWNHSRNLKRSLETAQAKVERQQRHIEFVQRKCRERQERVAELSSMFREADYRRVELCSALGIDPETGWADAMVAMHQRLMPEGMEWPMVDGKPIVIGERLVGYGSGDDGYEVVGVRPTCGWVLVKSYNHITRDGGPVILEWDASKCHRPAPKVLDADGAEIEGDERGFHAERLRVETILPDGLVECSPYNGGTWVSLEPSELYVNKPVPASDGRPLREGDTVWDVDGRGPLTVWRLPDKSEMYVSLKKDGTFYYRYPEKLTHERPDSWERLEEDCAKSDVDYCAERGLLDPSCDAVEGDASSRHCTDCGCTCGEKMARDLVRRAKALAERDR